MSQIDFDRIQNQINNATDGLNRVIDNATGSVNKAINRAADSVNGAINGASRFMNGTVNPSGGTPSSMYGRTPTSHLDQSAAEARRKVLQKSVQKKQVLYKKVDNEKAGAVMKAVMGFTLVGAGAVIGIGAISTGFFFSAIIAGLLVAAGIPIGVSGSKDQSRIDRFKDYVKSLGNKTVIEFQQLADLTGKSMKYVTKDVRQMINDRMFTQGHITEDGKSLIVSDETYGHYLEAKRSQEEQIQETEEKNRELIDSGLSKEGIEIVRQGEDYIAKIHYANDELPGEVISEKLQILEDTIARILKELKHQPDKAFELRKLMNYYLPTTWKLLESYMSIEKETVKTEQMINTEFEIENTIDKINFAFRQMLDQLFMSHAIDVSTDISVLNSMLQRDNLVEKDFKQEQ